MVGLRGIVLLLIDMRARQVTGLKGFVLAIVDGTMFVPVERQFAAQFQMSTRRDNFNLQLVGVDGSGMSSEVIVYLRFVGNLLVAYWAFCHGWW